MRSQEKINGLLRSPKLIWQVLIRRRYDFIYDQMPISMQKMTRIKRWNLFKAGTNMLYRRLRPWSMPLHMQIELSNYCNLRCPICATGSRVLARRPKAMDPALFHQLIKDVGPYLLTASLWGWGEGLLHPELAQILRIAQNRDLAFLLSTNGQNLDDGRVIEALLQYPPLCLIVAIDGLTDATNTQYRHGARLAPVLNGVKQLAKLKRRNGRKRPILHMRFMVMKHNQHELPQVEAFAKRNGFDFLTMRTLSIIDSEFPDRFHGNYVPELEDFKAYDYQNGERKQRKDFICQQPFWFPSVYADGTVVACEQDYNAQLSLGVMGSGVSFSDVWFGKAAATIRKMIRDTPGKLSFCRNCPFRDRPVTDASVRWRVLNPQVTPPWAIEGLDGTRNASL